MNTPFGPDNSAVVPGISSRDLDRWILSVDPTMALPLQAERIGIGQSNLTYLVMDSQGKQRVLRRPPVGNLLHSAHDVLREARILRALQETDVPVPRIYGTADAGEPADAPLVLMEFVDGLVLDELDVAGRLDSAARHAVGLGLSETLARIHNVDLERVGLHDLASHAPYADRQLRRWSGQWNDSKTADLAALDLLTDRLHKNRPASREITLVHGDLHLRNVIVGSRDGSIRSAIDWELSTLGDPVADLGTTLAYWPEDGESALAQFGGATILGFPQRAELVERYIERSGRDISDAELGFWHVLALWKVAIIAEGVLRRALEDPRNRAVGGAPDRVMVDAIVAFAHEVADAAGL